jgi:hypothetical protein
LAADLPALINQKKAGSGLAAAPALVLDKNGKDVATTSSEAAKLLRNHASLQINRKAAKQKAVNPYLAHRSSSSFSSSSASSSSSSTTFHSTSRGVSRGASRDFHFIKAGTLVARAERIRKKEEKGMQSGKVGKTHVIEDISSTDTLNNATSPKEQKVVVVAPVPASILEDGKKVEIVGCEWWDLPYLLPETITWAKNLLRLKASKGIVDVKKDGIFPCHVEHFDIERSKTWKLIQKPEMMMPVGEAIDPGPQPIRLTHKERKKIRRRHRKEKQMEEQDKIRLGIIPAPLPKVAMKNLMRVLGNEAVLDPSKMEKDIREGKEQRELDHEMRNLAAKKTPAEVREKRTAKLKGDREKAEMTGIHVAVFKISGELVDATKKFKIDMNARQLYLTGVCLMVQDDNNYNNEHNDYESSMNQKPPTNMVVVEGGKKGIKQYKKLMLRRIKWEQDHASYQEDERLRLVKEAEANGEDAKMKEEENKEDENDDDDQRDSIRHSKFPMMCKMVWEGIVAEPFFKKFRLEQCTSSRVARMFAKKNKFEHYWNMVEEE